MAYDEGLAQRVRVLLEGHPGYHGEAPSYWMFLPLVLKD